MPTDAPWVAFTRAITAGDASTVGTLLELPDLDVSKPYGPGLTPLCLACRHGHEAIVRLILLDGRANPNDGGPCSVTPLSTACFSNHAGVARLLLHDQRTDPNPIEYLGRTPLFIACCQGHAEVVKVLLEDGRANPNHVDVTGKTALTYACYLTRTAVVEVLLQDQRTNANWFDSNGCSAVHSACFFRQLDVLKMLLASSDRINLQARGYWRGDPMTAAELASMEQYWDAVHLLGAYEKDPRNTQQELRRQIGTPSLQGRWWA